MISERRLRKWRMGALKDYNYPIHDAFASDLCKTCKSFQLQILLMTQELLDLHLINKEKTK